MIQLRTKIRNNNIKNYLNLSIKSIVTYASNVWSKACTITGACGNKDSLIGGGKAIKFKLVLVVLPVKKKCIIIQLMINF